MALRLLLVLSKRRARTSMNPFIMSECGVTVVLAFFETGVVQPCSSIYPRLLRSWSNREAGPRLREPALLLPEGTGSRTQDHVSVLVIFPKNVSGEGAAGVRVVQGGQDHPAPQLPLHADAAGPLRHRSPEARPPCLLQVYPELHMK